MQNKKLMTEPTVLDGSKLWDEILKAIVSAMPSQLFPLFKEIYGRDYPQDTPVVLLNAETSSFQENRQDAPKSTLMDIALLVANTDYYHLECQMRNDNEMVIRMFAYDVRFAITHTKAMDNDTGEVILYFPHSVVIYPEKNNAIPNHLQCRVIFQDSSEHIYRIPTVKIQTYSLEEIHRKHLSLFLPYTILRLRPRLKVGTKCLLTEKELTEFVEEVILVLKEELSDGYLTDWEYHNYVTLFRFAADKILAKYPQYREEVKKMTEPLIKLPSMIRDEMRVELRAEVKAEVKAEMQAELQAEIANQQAEIANQQAEIANQQVEIANQRAEIANQQAKIANQQEEISDQKTRLAEKDDEIRRLRELLSQLSSDDYTS